jgi:hypothetical protein
MAIRTYRQCFAAGLVLASALVMNHAVGQVVVNMPPPPAAQAEDGAAAAGEATGSMAAGAAAVPATQDRRFVALAGYLGRSRPDVDYAPYVGPYAYALAQRRWAYNQLLSAYPYGYYAGYPGPWGLGVPFGFGFFSNVHFHHGHHHHNGHDDRH